MDEATKRKEVLMEATNVAANIIAARYAALVFYQQQQDEPLSAEQVQQIADTVMAEVGVCSTQVIESINKAVDS